MKKISTCFFIVFAFLIGVGATHVNEWLPNFEDVPMMDNTAVDAENSFILSKPDGKIVQTTITSDTVTRRQFQRFYRDALKELGWQNVNDDRHGQTFTRGTDQLKIDIVDPDPLRAQFTLTPKE